MKDLTTIENKNEDMTPQSARAMQEVQAAIILAKKFPRDTLTAIHRIKESCKRPKLAEKATYSYPKGGQLVTGPSIRMAELIAQNWGNLDFGVRELSSENGESLVESYCWDMETNVRQTKSFKVPHTRFTRSSGNTKLTDPRDIYEAVANQGARRLRACILGVIPQDVIEEATDEVRRTLAGSNTTPIKDRISQMMQAFYHKFQVSKSMLEGFLKHSLEEVSEDELVDLRGIFNSLKDGVSKRSDWFKFKEKEHSENSNKLNSLIPETKKEVDEFGVEQSTLEIIIDKDS